jgi:predicted transcriptional regulator of viral defense system
MADVGRNSDDMRPFDVQHPLDVRLARLATRQHGVVSVHQIGELGLSARGVRHRAEAGRLHRIHDSIYSLMPLTLLTRNGRFMAAVLACGPSAALSHRSAAALHEIRRTDRANIDVTIPQRSPRKHARLDIHRSTTLAPEDVTRVLRIPCTTVPRTLLDLAQVITTRQLERALDQAEILQLLDIDALLDQIERNKRRPAAKRLRAVLDEHYIGSTPTWSELEELLLAGCRRRDVPMPEVNAYVDPEDGDPNVLRVDFVWRNERVIVETDGHRTHSTRQAQEEDRWRDQRLQAAGWIVMRITWRQLTRKPDEVLDRLARLLRRRQHAARSL